MRNKFFRRVSSELISLSTKNELKDVAQMTDYYISTDKVTYAYVCDIIIDPLHRKKGLGNQLVKEMMSHPELQGLKSWALRSTDEARKIYLKNGFTVADHPETQLEINDLDIYSHQHFKNLHERKSEALRAKL